MFSEEQYAQAINRLARNEGHRARLPVSNRDYNCRVNYATYKQITDLLAGKQLTRREIAAMIGWSEALTSARLEQAKALGLIDYSNKKWSVK